jgi:hypothetical protein
MVSSEVVRPGRESFKRFLKIIVEQLPAHIKQYPPSDQRLLREFISVIQHYEEADYQRRRLSQRFEEYNDRIIGTDQYLKTAFLWFVYNYFSNANLMLNISKFHANLFYEYLVKHLRGSSDTLGVYGLVQKNIPLKNLVWEQLQYESNELLIPLTEDELQILNTVYSFIEDKGVYTLDPQKLHATIVNQVSFSKNLKPSTELNRFFTRLDGRWFLRFYSPAFGLDRVFFQFQLQESTSLKDVIDFQNPVNTVLCLSDIYNVRNSSNTYSGVFLVPTHAVEQLGTYLRTLESEDILILKAFSRIVNGTTSASLYFYRANNGWLKLSSTEMKRNTQYLKSKNPRKSQTNLFLFLPNQFNVYWRYSQHPLPIKIIELYCNIPHDYPYSNLPLSSIYNQKKGPLSRTEIGLLKQLHKNQVVQISFVPWRLVYEFSLDLYEIITPNMPVFQLKRFLNLLPFSEVYFTENSIHIRARIPSKLADWIENDLNWTIFSIMREHNPLNLELSWFDTNKLQWKTPLILR